MGWLWGAGGFVLGMVSGFLVGAGRDRRRSSDDVLTSVEIAARERLKKRGTFKRITSSEVVRPAVNAAPSHIESERIVNEYGAVLEAGEIVSPVSSLPYSKEAIKEAIRTYMKILHRANQLTPEFADSLIGGYMSVASFIDDGEAKIVNDHFTAVERKEGDAYSLEATNIFDRVTESGGVLLEEITKFRGELGD